MKNRILALILSLIGLSLNAQKIIEKNIAYKNQFITIDVKFASEITVKTWEKPTVYFKADITTKDGAFLDAYTLDVKTNGNTIEIVSKAKDLLKKLQDKWYGQRKGKNYYHTNDWYTFNYVVYIPKNAQFKISSINGNLKSETIQGDFTADLINGDIDIATYAGNLDLSTINGEIDLKMKNTTLVAETVNGSIYADEKLKLTSTDRHVGQKVQGSYGTATNTLHLNTVNGNMYLRL